MQGKRKSSIPEKILGNRAYPVIFLIVIVFIAVTAVMSVSNLTMAKILAERDAEIIANFEEIFPGIERYRYKDEFYEIYGSDDQLLGYAFTAVGKGYGGEINILVGIDTGFNIEKITILSNTETPGLGTNIEEDFFTDQFIGLGSGDVRLTEEGGKVDAITGATISSKAVTDAVQEALEVNIENISTAR